MPNNKIKALNVSKLKHFFPGDQTDLEKDLIQDEDRQEMPQTDDFINCDPYLRWPETHAWSKLLKVMHSPH